MAQDVVTMVTKKTQILFFTLIFQWLKCSYLISVTDVLFQVVLNAEKDHLPNCMFLASQPFYKYLSNNAVLTKQSYNRVLENNKVTTHYGKNEPTTIMYRKKMEKLH